MRYLSEILIAEHEVASFDELVAVVRAHAATERFLYMDVRPPFPDTPEDWTEVLEAAFTSPLPGPDHD